MVPALDLLRHTLLWHWHRSTFPDVTRHHGDSRDSMWHMAVAHCWLQVNEKLLLLLLAVALKSNRLSQPRAVDFSHIISPWLEANRCLVGWPHSVLPDRWKLFFKKICRHSWVLEQQPVLGTQSVLLFLMGKLHFRTVLGPSKFFMHALLAIRAGTVITKLVCARTVPILQSHPTTEHFSALKHRTARWFWPLSV